MVAVFFFLYGSALFFILDRISKRFCPSDGACSLPYVLGLKQWFDTRFGDLCDEHDARYVARDISKWRADWRLVSGIYQRSPIYLPVAVLVFLFCWSAVGLWYWYT